MFEEYTNQKDIVLIYDGECPFCSAYVKLVRVRDSIGELQIINAREAPLLVKELVEEGLDLDEGMVLRIEDRYYHGDECVHILALMSTNVGFFNRINGFVFKSKFLSEYLYPILRFGRNTVLKILGRKKISHSS